LENSTNKPVAPELAERKASVALLSLGASGALAALKFAAALATGSLGLLSEALHSLVDFGATGITYVAVKLADRPADDNHHFGHAKIESVAALFEIMLLGLIVIWFAYESISRLLFGGHEVVFSWWAVGVLVLSIIVDLNRSRALQKVANETSSGALAADAAHFHSDMLGSSAVLVGLLLVWAGVPWGDSAATLVVAAFIAVIAFRLARQTIAVLLDTAPEGIADRIRSMLEEKQHVLSVRQLRIKPAGPVLFISTIVDVPRTLPVEDVSRLKADIVQSIYVSYPSSDFIVSVNAIELDSETVFEKVQLLAAHAGHAVHHVTVLQLGDRKAVSFDIEFDGKTPLVAAHSMATDLEIRIRQELGPEVEVESHIEPLEAHALSGSIAVKKDADGISHALNTAAAGEESMTDVHNIRVRVTEGRYYVHYHCRFDGNSTVEDVHAAVDRVEHRLMKVVPSIKRVIAHAEPVGAAKHPL
jgi:cation diffusion facilitator family transporter